MATDTFDLEAALNAFFNAAKDGDDEGAEQAQWEIIAEFEWKPIDTAPKDGSHILVALPDTFGICGEQREMTRQTVAHWWPVVGEEGWYLSIAETEQQHPLPATHWKPLQASR